jgi:DNA-binding MarR family transcriptional regulator
VDDVAGRQAGQLNPVELRAWRELIETTALLRQRTERLLMADSGLSGSDYPILVTLHEQGDRMIRATELAALIGWEQSRLSHHLGRMERRGLVRRRTHPADNRVTEVHLTEQGRAVYLGATRGHSQAVRTHFADVLTAGQLESLIEIMDALRGHLRR